MKKPSKPSPKSKGSAAKPARHSKPAKKPVTIDLKAEKVEPKAAAAKTPETPAKTVNKPRTSVPGSGTKSATPQKPTGSPNPSLKPTLKDDAKSESKTSPPITASVASSAASTSASATKVDSASADKSTNIPSQSNLADKVGRDAGANKSASAKTTPVPPKSTTTQKPSTSSSSSSSSSSGLGGKLAAAVVGGVVALTGAGVLQYFGVLSTPGIDSEALVSTQTFDENTQQLAGRIAELETRLEQAATSAGDPAATDQASIEALIDARLANLPASSDPANIDTAITQQVAPIAERVASLSQSLDEVKTTLAAVQTTTEASGSDTTDQESIDTEPAPQTGTETPAQAVTEAEAEAAATEQAEQSAQNNQTAQDVAAIAQRVDDLTQKLSALQEETTKFAGETAVQDNAAAIANLTTTLTQDVDQRLQPLSKNVDDLQSEIASVKTDLGEVRELAGRAEVSDKRAARALAAAALKNTIDQGQPFALQIDVLRTSADDTDLSALDSLAAFAETGVPTVEMLRNRYDALRDDMLASIAPPQEDNLSSRLLSGAKSLVKMRSLSQKGEDGPQGQILAVSNSLADGKVVEAGEKWATLPDPAKAVSAKWQEGLQARIAADTIVSQTVNSLLKSTNGN